MSFFVIISRYGGDYMKEQVKKVLWPATILITVLAVVFLAVGNGRWFNKPEQNYKPNTFLDTIYSNQFHTSTSIIIHTTEKDDLSKKTYEDAANLIKQTFVTLNCEFTSMVGDANDCGTNGNLLELNASPVGQEIEITPDLHDILQKSALEYQLTDGYFDISQKDILDIWQPLINNRYPENLRPSAGDIVTAEEEVKNILDTSNINEKLSLTARGDKYYAMRLRDVRFDLGAIGKSYAANKVVSILSKHYNRFFINSGTSSMYVVGELPYTTKTIGVSDPVYQDNCNAELEYYFECSPQYGNNVSVYGRLLVVDNALGTSGDYEASSHTFVEGKRYHHIINPKTGMPTEGFRTVSIIHPDLATADAYSTALMAMPVATAINFIEKNELRAIAYDEENEVAPIYLSPLLLEEGLYEAISLDKA